MKKKFVFRYTWVVLVIIIIAAGGLWWNSNNKINITSIELTSPQNYAFLEDIHVDLDKPASIFVRYWKEGSPDKYHTIKTPKRINHTVNLLLLETDATYNYEVVIDRFINMTSKVLSFQTRQQSPWLEKNWVKEDKPHDEKALGDGMVLLCGARLPGYIAMVDGKGTIRWYWQIDDIGVRIANITPQGTIIAILRPPKNDVIDDASVAERRMLNKAKKPMRRGRMGYAGGTALAEIDLTGKILWRIDLNKDKDSRSKIIHHDLRMDNNKHIHTLTRVSKPFDMAEIGGTGIDTLVGDGILVVDTTGKEIWKWSAWDVWDIKNDPLIKSFAYDRFHMNALNFDKDSNYLLSVAIEDQIWKVNAKTGDLMWKLGINGDFKMDTATYFSFQHSVNINSDGDLMLFDNSLDKKLSRALSFSLDTVTMTATNHINAVLPGTLHSSRMGSAYLMPNGHILQTSSKKGAVVITSKTGEILWELDVPFVPYRAEYVSAELWNKYFLKD